MTEILPSKNPKNNPETWYVNEKIFDKYDILYIVGKVLEKFYSMMIFSRSLTETIPSKKPEKL